MLKITKKTEYMYKYMIGFLFLNFAIYSDIHYSISDKIIKYSRYIRFICLLIIIYICSLDTSSGILLAISYVFFENILGIKKYLRELFINYYENFSNSFVLSNNELKEIRDHCESEKWEGDSCGEIKKNVVNICSQNEKWVPVEMGEGESKITLDCPKIRKTF